MTIVAKPVAHNIVWNLAASLTPVVVALFALPALIHGLGWERFGLLSFVWMMTGYAAFLDWGVGRALAQGVVVRLGRMSQEEIVALVHTGVGLLLLLGVLGGFAIVASSWWLSDSIGLPAELASDGQRSLMLGGLAVPLVVVGSGLRAILEARQEFSVMALVRIIVSTLMYLSAVVLVGLTTAVWILVASLVLLRGLEVGILLFRCITLMPELLSRPALRRALLSELTSFGKWVTVTSVVGGILSLAYVDRMFIPFLLGAQELTLFVAPFDLAQRAVLFPAAVASALFPELTRLSKQSLRMAGDLAAAAERIVALGMGATFLAAIILARPALSLWIGADFARRSFVVLQLVGVGTLGVSLSFIPFALVQGLGRPDLLAKRHLVQVPFYVIASFVSVALVGIQGAALVWSLWAIVDFWMLTRIMKRVGLDAGQITGGAGLIYGFLFVGIALAVGQSSSLALQIVCAVCLPFVLIVLGWRYWLRGQDRRAVLAVVGSWVGFQIWADGRPVARRVWSVLLGRR